MFASEWRMGPAPEALCVRRAVFAEELGQSEADVLDGKDAYAAQLLVTEDGQPAASARLSPEGANARLAFVAVLPAYRGRGFGDLCVRQALSAARQMGATPVRARVPERCRAYYAAFGFRPVGEDPEEMAVETENIVWHNPCGE